MSLLGNLFNLPSVPKLDVPKFDSKIMSYSTASPQKLIDESYSHVNSVFGSNGPFTSLGTNIPSFSDLGVSSFTGSMSSDNPFGNIAGSELEKYLATESPFNASQVREAVGDSATLEDDYHKVKLVADVQYSAEAALYSNRPDFESRNQMKVVFDIMPEVSESHDVSYEALSPSQLPGEFQKYKNTASTKWTITGMFTARTREEARENYMYLLTLRTWTKPYFGIKQDRQFPDKLGAPPPIVMFSGWRGVVGKVPTVVTSLQWNWPNSVDWLPTGLTDTETNREIPFPAVINVTINLVETFSPQQFNNFDLVSYKYGDMQGAWYGDATEVSVSTRTGEPESEQTSVQEEPVAAEEVTATVPEKSNEDKIKEAETEFASAKAEFQAKLNELSSVTAATKAWLAANPDASAEEKAAKNKELQDAIAAKDEARATYNAAKGRLIAAGGTPS